MNPEIIGGVAAVLTTVAYIPQVIKVWKYKDTKSLSLIMYTILTAGIGLWTVFGFMTGSPSVILANGITFVLAGSILIMKIRHG